MTRLRILVVNWMDRANPRAGGAERHLHETFGRLAARGHAVTLLTCGAAGLAPRARLDGMAVHRTGGRHTFALAARAYFRRQFADVPFDVVVEDLNKLPLRVHRWSDRPTLLLVHHLFGRAAFRAAALPVALATWWAERRLGAWYAGVPVEAVSESTADELARRGIPRLRTRVNRNGVDAEFFAPQSDAVPEDTVPPVTAGDPPFVFVGRLARYKRADLLVRAIAVLRGRGVRARAVIAGEGAERDRLAALAARRGVGDAVVFPGRISEAAKRLLYQDALAHVLPSEKEGWGLSVLEAGACGTPTIAADAPGLRDAVLADRTGWLVPPGDARALADAMERLLRDPASGRAAGRAARAFAEAHSWTATADRLERHLAWVVAGRGAHDVVPPPLRPRHPDTITTLPRLGRGSTAFGTVRFRVASPLARPGTLLDGVLGSPTLDGRDVVLDLRGLDDGQQMRVAAVLRAIPAVDAYPVGATLRVLLPGWPDDPAAWVSAVLAEVHPAGVESAALPPGVVPRAAVLA